ncbi:MAG: hypothetical protein ACYTEQ_20380 [Planctomycetota bacterium]|jgi:hypothetical protein
MTIATALLAVGSLAGGAVEVPKTAAEMGIMQGSPPKRVVDMSKWDKGPDCRWAFQHISEIIPTANISRGSAALAELPRALQGISGLVFKTPDDDEMTVKDMLDATCTDGFIVLHEGRVVFEKYYNGMTPHTRRLLMSVSKSVTGTIAEKGLYAYAQTIRKDKREHGEVLHSASINTDVLGWLIERASGQRCIDFMSEAIWSKLGAEHDAQISVDYEGSAVADGGPGSSRGSLHSVQSTFTTWSVAPISTCSSTVATMFAPPIRAIRLNNNVNFLCTSFPPHPAHRTSGAPNKLPFFSDVVFSSILPGRILTVSGDCIQH